MRKWIIAVAILLTVPLVGAAATIVRGPEQEQLVEGHTVFTVIQVRNGSAPQTEEFAAAVAVLVRENTREIRYADRFPGVLWFNDQYLVNPQAGGVLDTPLFQQRHLCGAVIAVNAGDVVPQAANGSPIVPANATYVESYRITDPNDAVWNVDKWSYDPDGLIEPGASHLIWSVATSGAEANGKYLTGDDGTTGCGVHSDSKSCGYALLPFTDETPRRPEGYSGTWPTNRSDVYHDDGGYPLTSTPGGRTPQGEDTWAEGRFQCLQSNGAVGYTNRVTYNAVLYFFLGDLTDSGAPKNHATGPDTSDVNGCHDKPTYPSSTSAWPCPGGDDNDEGNSHPYNPERSWPQQLSEGRGNHGGSDECGANAAGAAQYMHATCNIDIYFGYVEKPALPVRSYRVFDMEGSTAPYHCHEDMTQCNEGDFNPAL